MPPLLILLTKTGPMPGVDPDRLRRGYAVVRELLLRERTPGHYWVGELSTSALSTATAVMALLQVQRATKHLGVATPGFSQSLIDNGVRWLIAHQNTDGGWGDTVKSFSNISTTMLCHATLVAAASEDRGSRFEDRGEDSGSGIQDSGDWKPGDGVAWSSLDTQNSTLNFSISRGQAYIDRAGGVPALVARYGKDKTFSIPILTHCALAGLVEWREVAPLPFELACLPARFYTTVRLPVVSYALPALIAIGQVRHHFRPTWNPLARFLRNRAIARTLRVLERIQPPNGGFLEATPLTSFVTMSLAAKGLVEHPVVRRGVEFIVNSVRPDGSWPIDTNLSTWVTTLAVNALGDDLPEESRLPILNWLLDQQFTEVHPYTNADPGGWAWTPLPGGVPDADDTAGAILAVLELSRASSVECRVNQAPGPAVATAGSAAVQQSATSCQPSAGLSHHGDTEARRDKESGQMADSPPRSQAPAWERTRREASLRSASPELDARVQSAVEAGVKWLLDLQNRDGGFPTFCRGWGKLPFDRSSPDITAHAVRALHCAKCRYLDVFPDRIHEKWNRLAFDPLTTAWISAENYLRRNEHPTGPHGGGYWLPLWFGNQHAPRDENATYGTARLLASRHGTSSRKGIDQAGGLWLKVIQNPDGGWGGWANTPSSVEETALATEALLDDPHAAEHVARGLNWLLDRIDALNDPNSSSPDGLEQPGCLPRTIADPAPIGFYFAKLWYFERLYPLVFAVSCLRRAVQALPASETGERRA